ncbi:MAG: hypothetical protein ACPGVT_10260 [Maricaulaceae bacterium]
MRIIANYFYTLTIGVNMGYRGEDEERHRQEEAMEEYVNIRFDEIFDEKYHERRTEEIEAASVRFKILMKNEWMKRVQNTLMAGNGAAIGLLGLITSKSTDPLKELKTSVEYFTPFLFGVAFAFFFAVIAAIIEAQDLIETPEDDPKKTRGKLQITLIVLGFASAAAFLSGLVILGLPIPR